MSFITIVCQQSLRNRLTCFGNKNNLFFGGSLYKLLRLLILTLLLLIKFFNFLFLQNILLPIIKLRKKLYLNQFKLTSKYKPNL